MKTPPPRPEELTAQARTRDHRYDPAYIWTPEDGGYRNGFYYGAEMRPGLGFGVAADGATADDDTRLCPGCGTQITFQWERGRYVEIERDAEGKMIGYGCDLDISIEECRALAAQQPSMAAWQGYGSPNDPRSKRLCNICSGRLGRGRDAMS